MIAMIINHLPDKTELIPSSHDTFMFVAWMAVKEAEKRKLPCIFMYFNRLITVNDGDKATQVYSKYLKRCNTTPTTTSDSLDDINAIHQSNSYNSTRSLTRKRVT